MSSRASTLATVAAWELRGAARSRWVLASALLYTAAAVMLSLAGLRSLRALGITGVGTAMDGLLNLGVLLPPLVGLLLGANAVSGARERGVLAMMASQPVSRGGIGWGMLFGLTGAVWAAVAIGMGLVAVVLAPAATWADLPAVGVVTGATLAASVVGVSLGLGVSSLTDSRSQATALAAGIWFLAALGIDLVLAGLAPGLMLGPGALLWVVLVNPLEAIRLFALMALDVGSLGPFGAYLLHRFGTAGSFLVLGGAAAAWTLAYFLIPARGVYSPEATPRSRVPSSRVRVIRKRRWGRNDIPGSDAVILCRLPRAGPLNH